MDFFSCAPSRIYRDGGFYEAPEQLTALLQAERSPAAVIEILREVFAPFHYERPTPQAVLTTDAGFRDSLLEHYGAINRSYRDIAASWLVVLREASVFRNVVYVGSTSRRVVYETYRNIDRDYVPLVEGAFEAEIAAQDDGHSNFFLGSAGSFNYGHWLTDDLPRVQALLTLRDARPVRIWVTSYNEPIDRVRAQSLRNFLHGRLEFEVRLFDQQSAIRFDRLLYATPVSYHPVLKNPAALKFVSEAVDFDGLSGGFEKIFITRRPHRGRALTNTGEIELFLTRRGFKAVDVEALGFAEQAYLFSPGQNNRRMHGCGDDEYRVCKTRHRHHFAGAGGLDRAVLLGYRCHSQTTLLRLFRPCARRCGGAAFIVISHRACDALGGAGNSRSLISYQSLGH